MTFPGWLFGNRNVNPLCRGAFGRKGVHLNDNMIWWSWLPIVVCRSLRPFMQLFCSCWIGSHHSQALTVDKSFEVLVGLFGGSYSLWAVSNEASIFINRQPSTQETSSGRSWKLIDVSHFEWLSRPRNAILSANVLVGLVDWVFVSSFFRVSIFNICLFSLSLINKYIAHTHGKCNQVQLYLLPECLKAVCCNWRSVWNGAWNITVELVIHDHLLSKEVFSQWWVPEIGRVSSGGCLIFFVRVYFCLVWLTSCQKLKKKTFLNFGCYIYHL